jgi:hypothetical protein
VGVLRGTTKRVTDLAFVLLVVVFFALAVLFLRACELVVGTAPVLEEEGER